MKKIILAIAIAFTFLNTQSRADQFPLSVQDFEILEINISGSVEWSSSTASGTAECSLPMFQELELEQNGKKLVLNWKNTGRPEWKSGTDKMTIRLSSELLRKVVINGSADLEFRSINRTPEFSLDIKGSGDFSGVLECSGKSSFSVQGSGDISASGRCSTLDLRISGSGDFSGRDLTAEKAVVKIAGSGDVKIYAEKELEAAISGSGDIRYWGKPAINKQDVSGSGNIRPGK